MAGRDSRQECRSCGALHGHACFIGAYGHVFIRPARLDYLIWLRRRILVPGSCLAVSNGGQQVRADEFIASHETFVDSICTIRVCQHMARILGMWKQWYSLLLNDLYIRRMVLRGH